ncbi:MAG: class I SAM-dependent methyltransferase [Limnobacter sp.]|nr:class I SAM-dependent methyltransferase [Limnobacter sp.]
MHTESIKNMKQCRDLFLGDSQALKNNIEVVDLGSQDVNGSYRELFPQPTFKYTGVDVRPGPGVDVVAPNPYHYPLPSQSADVIVSGQMLEHHPHFWHALSEVKRLLKPGGLFFLIVPSKGPEHRFPIDCYRFLPDSMTAMATASGMRLLKSWVDEQSEWGDLVGVFECPKPAPKAGLHQGMHYSDFIAQFVSHVGSKAHFEVGTFRGDSLQKINNPCLSVDPQYQVQQSLIGKKEMMLFFQMTSDEFFARHNPESIFGRKLDTAFLDGMHLFEYLLRDFIHTEKACHQDSSIFLHDCLPFGNWMTHRHDKAPTNEKGNGLFWTGDVWKLLPILKKHRPDLSIQCLDCPPSGLVRITNLDPGNKTLEQNYDLIVREWTDAELKDEHIPGFLANCHIIDSSGAGSAEWMQSFIAEIE